MLLVIPRHQCVIEYPAAILHCLLNRIDVTIKLQGEVGMDGIRNERNRHSCSIRDAHLFGARAGRESRIGSAEGNPDSIVQASEITISIDRALLSCPCGAILPLNVLARRSRLQVLNGILSRRRSAKP